MKNTILVLDMKKILIVIVFIISFIILLPLALIGKEVKEIKEHNDKGYVKENNIQEKEESSLDILKGDISVYISKEDRIETMSFEEYIKGVVSAEMQASFEIEALKAQAIAARNFSLNKIKYKCTEAKGADVCDTVHCQVYKSKDVKLKEWGKGGEENYKKISQAVDETKGEFMYYDKKLVASAQFFAISSGKTENSKDVFGGNPPYLKSVMSPGEEAAPKYKSSKTIKLNTFINTVNKSYPKAKLSSKNVKSTVAIQSRTEGGSVNEIKLGSETIRGVDFRKLFNLNSANFTLTFNKDSITIECVGYGHGVGMSQWGANAMAKNGSNYKEILTHYYSGVTIEKDY
ncbi:stage II sporulation protein D [Clostridium sp.]|uniref:stage II sporulation protein D n=1 Tax=Clostridium sp. TaxID=1506 RepID=UPI003464B505